MRRVRTFVAFCVLSSLPCAGFTEDWPEFRGPGGQGHSAERGLPSDWSESNNVLWKTPIAGLGWSSPVVSAGRVWVTTATGEKDVSLRALAFDIATGQPVVNVELFNVPATQDINPKNSWASPTPVIAGDRVYVHFGALGTAALTTWGDVVWKTSLPYTSQHGAGGSPVVYGDLLLVNCDGHDAAFVAALDVRTGKLRWKTNRRQPADQAYTTPLVIRVGERDQLISVGAFRATAYEPSTGKEIWRVSYADGFSNVPRPVYAHNHVYIATGFQQPTMIAVRADGSGDVTGTHVTWTLRRGAPLTPSPLVIGDELYLVTDGGIASCVDAKTGATIWQQRIGGTYSASPIFADGRIFFLSEGGTTTVITPGRTFQKVATNVLDGATLASMAVAEQSLFIRSDTHLYRIASRPAALGGR